MGVPRHVLIGTLTTDARVLVQALSHKFSPTEKGQLAEKKQPLLKTPPEIHSRSSAIQQMLGQKHVSPRRALSHPAQRVLAVQWLSGRTPEPVIATLVGPREISVNFVIGTGALISVITKETTTEVC